MRNNTSLRRTDVPQPYQIRNLLLLVDVDISVDDIAMWYKEQAEAAIAWASALHLAASDNNVRVPPKPDFLP